MDEFQVTLSLLGKDTPHTYILLMQRDPHSRRSARPLRTPTLRAERRGRSLLELPEVELGNPTSSVSFPLPVH